MADEPTPIHDFNAAFRKIALIGSQVKRLTAQEFPALARDVHVARTAATEANEQVVMVRLRQEDMGRRLQELNEKDHVCLNQQELDHLKEHVNVQQKERDENINARAQLDSLTDKVKVIVDDSKDLQKRRRVEIFSVLLAAVGIITTLISLSWNLGGDMNRIVERLEAEKTLRAEQHATLKARLDQLPTSDKVPTRSQVETISQTITENGHSFDSRCKRLDQAQKNYLARQIQQGKLPPAFLCL
jgi:hypothetical protein